MGWWDGEEELPSSRFSFLLLRGIKVCAIFLETQFLDSRTEMSSDVPEFSFSVNCLNFVSLQNHVYTNTLRDI